MISGQGSRESLDVCSNRIGSNFLYLPTIFGCNVAPHGNSIDASDPKLINVAKDDLLHYFFARMKCARRSM
jgi:hypothetical protein